MPACKHFSNSSHLGKVPKDLLDLLLCCDRVQLFIFISIYQVETIKLRSVFFIGV